MSYPTKTAGTTTWMVYQAAKQALDTGTTLQQNISKIFNAWRLCNKSASPKVIESIITELRTLGLEVIRG